MSDERRQPSVNLDELERQLREASRARLRAQAATDTLNGTPATRSVGSEFPSQPSSSVPQGTPYQPGLPLSPAPAPAPMPAQPGFRPLPSQHVAPPRDPSFTSAPPPLRAPQPTYQPAPPLRPREMQQSFAPPPEAVFQPRSSANFAPEYSEPEANILKTDQMGEVYPPVETEAVGQDQFYSAAAYEEPAENSYDQYTEDQFPRISAERRASPIIKAVVWIVIIAIIGGGAYVALPLLTGLVMPSNQTAKAPPLIKPDPNPVKVQPEAQPQTDNALPKDIFTKHANEDPKSAQMAASAEQPVDVNAAAKAGAQSAPNVKPVIVPLVPGTGDPRLVKTVTVRADGTIIPEKSDPELAAKTLPTAAKAVTMPIPFAPVNGAAPASLPPLPTSPVAESPEFNLESGIPMPPERIPDAEAEISLPLDAITTPMPVTATPAPAPVAAPEPVPTAPAAVITTVPGKDFAVQFGAPETEAKGNELKSRIEKQFASALTGGSVAIVKGDSNGKPVFRVRAIGYTRDEANAVCQQVTAAGGQCFVSKNN